jgi:3-methyladenine DNA glycosylase AlkC
MPFDLKSFFNPRTIAEIAAQLQKAHPAFAQKRFIADCLKGLDALELTARGWHIAEVMRTLLPQDFPQAARILTQSLPPENAPAVDPESSMDSFRYLPHCLYVSKYGLDHFEEAMHAQYELTKRFTAEFSVRPFFEKYPAETHARFLAWARDPNVHVRRLVSEGARPRLPWAARLRSFQADPSPVLELLELLKDDPELYVRRSVANNLNDIAKDHPDLVVEVCRRWMQSKERAPLVRHALRSLVKQGHPGALSVVGYAGKPQVRIANPQFHPKSPKIGEKLRLAFNLISASSKPQSLLVDYRVHYIKANGKPAPKVFKLSMLTLPARGSAALSASLSLHEMTTRKHYPGIHKVEALVNGVPLPLGSFDLRGL